MAGKDAAMPTSRRPVSMGIEEPSTLQSPDPVDAPDGSSPSWVSGAGTLVLIIVFLISAVSSALTDGTRYGASVWVVGLVGAVVGIALGVFLTYHYFDKRIAAVKELVRKVEEV